MGASVEIPDESKAQNAAKCDGLIDKLNFLCDLGFHDLDKNIENLRRHKFNLDQCVDELLNS